MNECDTCVHNRGHHCDAEHCDGGDGYEDNRVISCPFCGGRLSTVRTDTVAKWRQRNELLPQGKIGRPKRMQTYGQKT